MAKTSNDYFGLGRLLSVILAFIPFTALILGVATRLKEGKIVAAILRIFVGWNIVWICDFILMILNGKILRLLNI